MENKYSRKYIIGTGIGLQDVDNLKNSDFFLKEAERYIKGEISLDELDNIITSYYENKKDEDERVIEADISSVKIGALVSDDSFSFTIGQLIAIHKQLFDGVFPHAGKLRSYNFSKREWVLDGASVAYGDYRDLSTTLQYDLDEEKKFNYASLSMDDVIDHLALFVANLWQIHAFEEGNTRTTAVFLIKYLRTLGFDVTNDLFEKNSRYFRNALVRANYKNIQKKIYEDRSFLIKFLRNLLLGEQNELHNRDLVVHQIPVEIVKEADRKMRILTIMKNNPKVKVTDIASELNISQRTVKSIINSLEEQGLLKRVNGKRFGYWEVQ